MKEYAKTVDTLSIPSIRTNTVIFGKSTQNKDLVAFCFGNCTTNADSFLLFSNIHGREGLTIMMTLELARYFVSSIRLKDPKIMHLLKHKAIWIIPSLNPDAYDDDVLNSMKNPSHQLRYPSIYGNKRKNMKDTCPLSKRHKRSDESGIDLNRNFPVCFDIDEEGSSRNPCSDIYRGESPLSEIETASFVKFLHSFSHPPLVAFSLHSYGRSVLHPFSCKSLSKTLNASTLFSFTEATKDILRTINAKYTCGQAWAIPGLYTVNGDAVDYLYHVEHIPSFSVELPPDYPQLTDEKGFWPPIQSYKAESLTLILNACKLVQSYQTMKLHTINQTIDELSIHTSNDAYIAKWDSKQKQFIRDWNRAFTYPFSQSKQIINKTHSEKDNEISEIVSIKALTSHLLPMRSMRLSLENNIKFQLIIMYTITIIINI